MAEKINLQYFKIQSLYNNKIIESTITVWIEKIEDPTVIDVIAKKTYNFQGKFDIFFIEYTNGQGMIVQNSSDRLSNAFYGLSRKLEGANVKMLIKGCSLGYYMIPRLQYSIKAVELKLGKRVDAQTTTVCIFDAEFDVNKIVKVSDIENYYKEWIESIKGMSY